MGDLDACVPDGFARCAKRTGFGSYSTAHGSMPKSCGTVVSGCSMWGTRVSGLISVL
jgi:hypothetical protein